MYCCYPNQVNEVTEVIEGIEGLLKRINFLVIEVHVFGGRLMNYKILRANNSGIGEDTLSLLTF